MSTLGFHVRTRLATGEPIVRSTAQRGLAARCVIRLGGSTLSTFSLPDLLGMRVLHHARNAAEAGELCRRIEIGLSRRLGLSVGFVMYPPKPFADQWHLERTLVYILTQHDHHGVQTDPFYESSLLPDLLGMRVLHHARNAWPALQSRLPRLTRARLLQRIGWPALRPADGPLESLVRAACRARALPTLRGHTPDAVSARNALVHVAGPRLSTADLATQLHLSPRTVQHLRKRPADPALVHAIRLQLGAEATQAAKQARAAAQLPGTAKKPIDEPGARG